MEFARVICVVQINLGIPQRLIEFPSTGLKITKKHPIWWKNQWKLPADIEIENKNVACFTPGRKLKVARRTFVCHNCCYCFLLFFLGAQFVQKFHFPLLFMTKY